MSKWQDLRQNGLFGLTVSFVAMWSILAIASNGAYSVIVAVIGGEWHRYAALGLMGLAALAVVALLFSEWVRD